jgi:hypothetical protein
LHHLLSHCIVFLINNMDAVDASSSPNHPHITTNGDR